MRIYNQQLGTKKILFLRQLSNLCLIGLMIFSLTQCDSAPPKKTENSGNNTFGKSLEKVEKQIPPINYHLISTKDSSEWLKALPAGDTLQAILVLNRIDRNSLLRLDTLVIPDTIGIGTEIYSPFPKTMNNLSSVHKILFVSYYAQAFGVYENGLLVRWGPVSLGKESTPTPTGLLSTNWKSKRTISTVDPTWVMDWYFNLENFQGVSMHQYALPGYPASHACIRLYDEDAYWFYNWADQWILDHSKISVYGTPVVIFGTYPFSGRKPWLLLADNNKALEISSSELMTVAQEYLPTIMNRQAKRDSVQVVL